jgi:hypothetical protein
VSAPLFLFWLQKEEFTVDDCLRPETGGPYRVARENLSFSGILFVNGGSTSSWKHGWPGSEVSESTR